MVRGDGEGRPYGDAEGEGEESVIGSEIPRLGFAAFGMTMVRDGFPPPSSRGQALRGNNGGWGGRPQGTPLRVVNNAGFYGIGAVYFHGNAMHHVQRGRAPTRDMWGRS